MKRTLFSTLLSTTILFSGGAWAAMSTTDSVGEISAESLPDLGDAYRDDFYLDEDPASIEKLEVKVGESDVSLFNPVKDPAGVTSMKETMERAYMQSSELDSARAELRATDENVAVALSGWRPSATIRFRQTQRWELPSGKTLVGRGPFTPPAAVNRPNTHTHDTAFDLSGEQNIFEGGRTYAQTERAKENVFAGRFGLLGTEQTVLVNSAQSFLDVITNEAIAELRKSSENFLHKTWEQTQVRYEVGEVTRTEVEAAKSSYLGARAQRIDAEGNVETARATYERVVGSPAGTLGKAEIISELPRKLEDAKQLALVNNPGIHQASHTIEAAEYNVNDQIGTLLPRVDVSADISRSEDGGGPKPTSQLGNNRQTRASFVTTASMPLYDRGLNRAQIRQAHQQVAQRKVELVTAKRAALEATTRAWEDLESARSQVESLIAQVKAGKLAVEGVSEEAAVGTKNVLDVLQEEDRLVESQIRLVQAERQLVLASYQVLVAVGHMTAPDLNLDVKLYNPEDYYDEYSGALFQSWEGDDYRYVRGQNEDDD